MRPVHHYSRILVCHARVAFVLLTCCHVAAAVGSAQATGTVRGTVRALETGEPLANAEVSIVGTSYHTKSDRNGAYEFAGLSPGDIVMRLAHPGRARVVEKIQVHAGAVAVVHFEMAVPAQILQALSVMAGEEQSVDNRAVVAVDRDANPSGRSVSSILDGVTGVQLVRTSGEVGKGYFIRIRGVNSFTFSSTPVVFIDGIRVQVDGLNGSMGVLDLMEPTQVGRVEVLRGSAAGAMYGPDTSNGVILITTKRGHDRSGR